MTRQTKRLPTTSDREGLRLEFKRAEILRSSDGRKELVRTIVAMRNEDGGTIWVGCHEQNGRWNGFDPLVENDYRHRDALRNQIVDSIEPPIDLGRSVRLEPEELEEDLGWVLRIAIAARDPHFAPYCVKSGNQREFLRRVDDRNALIPYSELHHRPVDSRVEPGRVRKLLEELCGERLQGLPSLAFLVVPETISPDPGLHSRLRSTWDAPEASLDPVPGRGWFAGEYREVQKRGAWLQSGKPNVELPYRVLCLKNDGTLFFYTHVHWIRSGRVTNADRDPLLQDDDWPPHGWLEEASITATTVALTRLASKVVSEVGTPRAALTVSFQNVEGWGLRIVDSTIKPKSIQSKEVSAVLVRSREELVEAPDLIALDLLRHVYDQVVDPGDRELRATDFPWFQADGAFAPPQ